MCRRKPEFFTFDYARYQKSLKVKKGDILCTLYANDDSRLEPASEKYLSSLVFSTKPPDKVPLIHDIIR